MVLIALLIAAGSALVFLETLLVGGIWAAAGIGCYVWAAWLAYSAYGTAAAVGVGAVSAAACTAAFLVWLYVIPKTSLGKKIYLDTAQSGRAPAPDFAPLVGRTAKALTLLVPTGKVEIDATAYDARCLSDSAEIGDSLEVVSANSFELIVKKTKTDENVR